MGKIHYQQAQFLLSVAELRQLPPEKGGEVAFIGRSNVGKSSVINTLTDRRGLAKVSRTPGRTQLINFFALEDQHYLVDLPGYGFAKVHHSIKKRWEKTLEAYLQERKSLKGLILIMDIRHPLKDSDRLMLDWTTHYHIPTHIVLNKADKLSRQAMLNTQRQVAAELHDTYTDTSVQTFSALKKEGLPELVAALDNWL